MGTIIALVGVVLTYLAWQWPGKGEHGPAPEPTTIATTPVDGETDDKSPESPPEPSTPDNASQEENASQEDNGKSTDVPNALLGTWLGRATNDGYHFTVQLALQQGGIGDYVGSLQIPEGGCRSDLTLESVEAVSISVDIKVLAGTCFGGSGRFALTPAGLDYRALGTQGSVVFGTLFKQ
ncbi:hypothetical protein [Sinosporangium siamense]|uniref:hypothetical protein n=1 Tax=Sinosporangium siamense TaxID=1367973 RepID=UPI00195139A9|nr:hypothetical protein [Sinosporangium siamense]